ncbi:MAG: histidine triad nucleotide-binding protein [Gemmatimonadetes bacterium GWC2_71_10]|nr:MAG: histidine triad nucleotide-binding protein [Gemmatimonadetes bacterium GWC2_71_10]
MAAPDSCVFCQIVQGTLPADIVYRMPMFVAFRDTNPQAPDHLLIVSADHIESLATCEDPQLLGTMLAAAHEVARKVHIDHGGYRVVVNTGKHGGQTVQHLHYHVLGGRRMQWPPG